MAATNDPEVQRFRRVALQRFGEAQFLIEGGYNTGAIYLAGYAVECALKALLLAAVPARSRKKVLASFRGNNGHSFEWIKLRYIKAGGANFPPRNRRRDHLRQRLEHGAAVRAEQQDPPRGQAVSR